MQISFLSLTSLSKPSTSSSSFSSTQNKITTLRNTLEEHMGKNKFPCTQMLSTKYTPPPPQTSITASKMFLTERKKRSSLQWFPYNTIIQPSICMGASTELHYSYRGLWN